LLCPKCLSQVTQTTFDGVEYCPVCQTKLPSSPGIRPVGSTSYPAKPQAGRRALTLLKDELSKMRNEVSKKVAVALMEKWRGSGSFLPELATQPGEATEAAMAEAISNALAGSAWVDDKAVEFLGKLETSVSISFPLALETGAPSASQVTIPSVRVVMIGTVDVVLGTVTNIRVGVVEFTLR